MTQDIQSINELKSYTEYNVSTPTSVFTIGFQYEYNVDGINVYVDDVEATAAGYTVQHDSQGTVTLTPAVSTGVVRVSRETNIDTSAHTFSAGAKFTAGNMDENFKQMRYAQQEVRDVVLRTASEFSILDANATAALQDATTAVNTANSIDAKATTALSNSNTALSVANGIDAKATSALNSANTAVTTANTADSNATTALNTANTAQSVANGIDAKATQAQSDASTALSTVTTQKGAANGIAPLNEDAQIDPIYIESMDVLPYLPLAYPKSTPPTGYLVLMGQTISQATYPILYSLYGATLPDLRGQFLRGLDYGRGIDSGRGVLTIQQDDIKSHTHTYSSGAVGFNINGGTQSTSSTAPTSRESSSTGGTETRPKNIAFLYIVKAG